MRFFLAPSRKEKSDVRFVLTRTNDVLLIKTNVPCISIYVYFFQAMLSGIVSCQAMPYQTIKVISSTGEKYVTLT